MVDLSRLLFLGALLLTACTAATSPSLYRVTELVPGISTRDDAIAKLGPPSSTSNIGTSTILQWGGNNSPVHLAISFGMDGRMIQAATDAQSNLPEPLQSRAEQVFHAGNLQFLR